MGPLSIMALLATAASAEEPAGAVGAYVEADYAYNLARPGNGVTNLRGFDNRHDTFTLQNVALDGQWDDGSVVGRLTLQVGHTPSTYYLAEPAFPGANGANATGPEVWKYVQQGYAGYRTSGGVLVAAGLFLSPIGPEGMAVRDNWNWSRSNLFFGLPFYHTGARVTVPLGDEWSLTTSVFNGWNSVVDNNRDKSVDVQLVHTGDAGSVSLQYFGGVERPEGAPEGQPWRNLVDVNATWAVSDRVSLLTHVNGGFEVHQLGTSAWAAGAQYARFQLADPLFLAVRGDVFWEQVPDGASAIFWPVDWVASGTATLELRPADRASFRLEVRHDQAADDAFFGPDVRGDGLARPFVADRAFQDTVTLGATTWF